MLAHLCMMFGVGRAEQRLLAAKHSCFDFGWLAGRCDDTVCYVGGDNSDRCREQSDMGYCGNGARDNDRRRRTETPRRLG
jgi:hypothetical protein